MLAPAPVRAGDESHRGDCRHRHCGEKAGGEGEDRHEPEDDNLQ